MPFHDCIQVLCGIVQDKLNLTLLFPFKISDAEPMLPDQPSQDIQAIRKITGFQGDMSSQFFNLITDG